MKKILIQIRIKDQKGTGLVEAMITVVLFSVISAGCIAVLLSGFDSWKVNNAQLEVQGSLRKSVDWMKEDLLEAGVATISDVPADGNTYSQITFKTCTGVSGGSAQWSTNNIQFSLSGNQLRRTSGAQTKTIAQNIQTLQFKRMSATPNYLEVSLTGQKSNSKGGTISETTSFKICLRE